MWWPKSLNRPILLTHQDAVQAFYFVTMDRLVREKYAQRSSTMLVTLLLLLLLLLVASCPAHTRVGRVDLWNAAEQEFSKAELWERQAEPGQQVVK